MWRQIILYILFASILAGNFSCSKSSQIKKLTGSWDEQFFDGNPENKQTIWIFKDDGTLQIEYIRNSEQGKKITMSPVVNYNVKGEFLDAFYLYVTGLGISPDGIYLDGKYRIMKLNNSQLIIQRVEMYGSTKGAYLRKEFVKL